MTTIPRAGTSLVIRGGLLFDLDHDGEPGDLLVEDGRIAAVGVVDEVAGGADVTTIDARDHVVIPGLINAHTHSNQTIEKGLCDALPLDAWMVLASYGGAGVRLQPRDLYVSAMLGGIEMLETGTTSVLDCARVDREWFDEGLDAIARAYDDLGLRAAIAVQYADLDFFSSLPLELIGETATLPPRADPAEVLSDVERFLDRWQGRSPLVTPMLGPSSLPRCSIELFEASVELAKRKRTRLQTHLLSARSQVPVARARYGGSTVAFLERIGALEDWASFAHTIWLDDHEVGAFGASPAVAVHNPVSNLKLGAGVAPVPGLLRAGATVALGADGASSNDSQNLFETLKLAALLTRVTAAPDNWLGARPALRMAWEGGRAALGHEVGRLEVGARADLVLLTTDGVFPAPPEQLANQLVYGEVGRSVRTVVVAGRVVVDGGRVVTVDTGALRAEARELAARIWAGLPDRLARFEVHRPALERLEQAVSQHDLGFGRSCCL